MLFSIQAIKTINGNDKINNKTLFVLTFVKGLKLKHHAQQQSFPYTINHNNNSVGTAYLFQFFVLIFCFYNANRMNWPRSFLHFLTLYCLFVEHQSIYQHELNFVISFQPFHNTKISIFFI